MEQSAALPGRAREIAADKLLLPEPRWLEDTVFYQIFPERFYNGDVTNDPFPRTPWGSKPQLDNFFGGDLDGIIKKIPYLTELGINALYLNPIFDSPSNHKYNTKDYMRISPEFGDFKTYLRMVKKLHETGIKLILDGVFNHTGDQFWAFRDIMQKGERSPYRNWYLCHQYPVTQSPVPNYDCWWGIGTLPKLNYAEPAVVRYILRVVAFWTLTGINGWRLDVPNEVTPEFWPIFRRLVKGINPQAYIVGEIWEDADFWLQGNMFDSVMNYCLRDLVVSYFARQEIGSREFDQALAQLREKYSYKVTLSMFNLLGSHDTPRFLTVCEGKKERFMLSLLFLMTYPGVPVIYYGDEIGMTGDKDPDCRKTMIWDRSLWDKEIFETTKKLIRLRKEKMPLRRGEIKPIKIENDGVYGYWRTYGQERLLIVFNRTDAMQEVCVSNPDGSTGIWQQVYPVSGKNYNFAEGEIHLHLPPSYGAIWEYRS